MKQKIKILKNNLEIGADTCQKTNIATVKMAGFMYKFSQHEYELVEE